MAWSIRARAPRGTPRVASLRDAIRRDPDVVAAVLEDAAHFPGGHAGGLVTATREADIAQALTGAASVLPIGAQSSLTGGATPMGEVVLTTNRLNRILDVGSDTVRVESGVTLTDLDEVLRRAGRYYPPVPTFLGATVGGTIATNAAGAATFKYGTTRDWVTALTVVLPNGCVLDIERGAVQAHTDGYFEITSAQSSTRVPVPGYRMPQTAKLSAG
jgi:D-lactate dehydrogenase (cytochrome)